MKKRLCLVLVAFPFCLWLGCGHADPPSRTIDAVDEELKQKAERASTRLFETLSSRLADALKEQGPSEAIAVCKSEAKQIAARVSEEEHVRIGRTSFKLRNSDNQPPDWAVELVERRVDEPTYVDIDQQRVVALVPIFLKPKCLLCHGAKSEIPIELVAQLTKLYPDDEATGFREGDLRGWFWIEIPKDDRNKVD